MRCVILKWREESAKSGPYVRSHYCVNTNSLGCENGTDILQEEVFFLRRYILQCLEMKSHDLDTIISNGLGRKGKPHTRKCTCVHTHTRRHAHAHTGARGEVTHTWPGLGLSAGESGWRVCGCSLCYSELFVRFDIYKKKLGKIKYNKAKKKNSEGTGIVIQTVGSWTHILP